MFNLVRKKWLPLVLLLLAFMIIIGSIAGMAATNIVAESGLSHTNHPMTANQLKPAECTMNLVNIIVPSNGDNSTQQNDLVLGTSGDDTGGNRLRGSGGDDCIVGGGGNDTLRGNKGNDILIGGNGDDTLIGGNQNDICYGNAGNDTYAQCESTP
jgi:Ca2+-binding RTX toxin-like protein